MTSSHDPATGAAHPSDDMTEEILEGGGVNVVTRIGSTVRRPVQPWTAAVHVLLRHLADVGFDGAPRVLGVDDQGREILDYLAGEVGN